MADQNRNQLMKDLENPSTLNDLILNSTNEIIGYFDQKLDIIWYNNAALNAAGYKKMEDIRGLRCHDIWDNNPSPCQGCPVRKSLNDGMPHILEKQTSDGRYWLIRSFPLFESDGKVRTAAEFVIDITEKKNLEKQLIQSQKMESIGRLAGGIAHDFNNTLNIINGISEMAQVKHDRGVTDFRSDFEDIKEAVSRSSDLTKQLLTFARRQSIKPVPLNLNEKISGTLRILDRLIGSHAELIWNPGPELLVYMDPVQLDRILSNLIINSRDALQGSGRIILATDRGDDFALIRVIDNGSGMDNETLSQIFEPFFTTKEEGKGTGLGLSTVYGIIQQNGGTITCDSIPGEGTEFVISLPVAESR